MTTATTTTATVTTTNGNICHVDLAPYIAEELAGIGPVEGKVPNADLIAAKLSGSHFSSWTRLGVAIGTIVGNDESVWVTAPSGWGLHDYDTGERLGYATVAQVDASLAAGPIGVILINGGGDVVTPGSWAARQLGVRKVYVA